MWHAAITVLVHVSNDKVVFTGDILFIDDHPIMWAGPAANWLKACDKIIAMDVDIVVPGHGPITDRNGVKQIKGYFEYLYGEAKTRFDKGMTVVEAALDIESEEKSMAAKLFLTSVAGGGTQTYIYVRKSAKGPSRKARR